MSKVSKRVEQDFMAALQRLKQEAPLHPTLVAQKNLGKLKVTVSAVALEAGHARRFIAHENCELREVRDAVILAIENQPTGRARESLRAEIKRLRVENAEMQDAMEASAISEADLLVKDWNVSCGRAEDGSALRVASTRQRRSALRLASVNPNKP